MIDLIDNLPVLLLYFFPGFFGVCAFRFLSDKKISSDLLWIESIGLSYVGLALIRLITHLQTEWSTFLWQSILCLFVGVVGAKLFRWPFIQGKLQTHFSILVRDGVLNNVVDWVNGCEVFLQMRDKDEMWYGTVETVSEPNAPMQWICISAPQRVNSDGQRLWPEAKDSTIHDQMVFHLEDVKNMRFIYPT